MGCRGCRTRERWVCLLLHGAPPDCTAAQASVAANLLWTVRCGSQAGVPKFHSVQAYVYIMHTHIGELQQHLPTAAWCAQTCTHEHTPEVELLLLMLMPMQSCSRVPMPATAESWPRAGDDEGARPWPSRIRRPSMLIYYCQLLCKCTALRSSFQITLG